MERITYVVGSADNPESLVPKAVLSMLGRNGRRAIPAIAASRRMTRAIESAVASLKTRHELVLGDCRTCLAGIPDESVHLVLTSPPYWTLKQYPPRAGQLGLVDDYDAFLDELDHIWRHAYRVLVPGGRLIIVAGDVCLPRRRYGRHTVFPLHASIQERCRKIGFDNLTPILWYKISNASFEARGGRFFGKPYEPNAVIKNDVEYVLFQRKPGGYRRPTPAARVLSVIPVRLHREWFRQIWRLPGTSSRDHPSPFPLRLAERLVRMFSFAGDVVLDPFAGTGTTNLAAALWGRHSIGIEIEPAYFEIAKRRILDLVSAHQARGPNKARRRAGRAGNG